MNREKKLESDWIDERDKEWNASVSPSFWPCVYLPFLKGTSVERVIENDQYLIE